MPDIELDRTWVSFPLYGAWNRSLARHLLGRPSVSATAGRTPALADVSLSLRAGERLAVLGSNGSGKTTLARVAAGLIRPLAGRATISGHPFAILSLGCDSHPDATVFDTAVFHALLAGHSLRRACVIAQAALEFGNLSGDADRPAGELSAGNLLRMGLGTAIALEADIIVLDEVMDTADPEFVRHAIDLLMARSPGIIVLVIERSRSILDHLCNRALVLERGRCVDDGPYDAVMARHRDRYTF